MTALADSFSGVLKLNPLVKHLLVKAAEYSFTTLKRPPLNAGTDVSNTAVQLRFKDVYVLETTVGLDYVDLFGDMALNALRDSPEEVHNLEASWSFNSIQIWGTTVIVFVLGIIAVMWGFSVIKRRITKSSVEKKAMGIRVDNLTTSLKGANDHLAKLSTEQEATGTHLKILATDLKGTEDKTANMSTKQEAIDILLETLTTGLEGTEEKTVKLEGQVILLSSGLSVMERAHKAEIVDIRKGYERRIADFCDKIAQTEENQGRKIAKLQDQFVLLCSKQAGAYSDYENKIAEINKIHGDQIAELRNKIAELENEHGRQIADLEKENAELKKDHGHRIAKLSVQQNTTENRVAYSLAQQTTTFNECRVHSREHDAKLQQHVHECDRRLDIASHQQEKQLKDSNEGFQKFTAYHQEALEVNSREFNTALADISKQHKKDLDEMQSQIQEKSDNLSRKINDYFAWVSRRGQQDFEQFTKRITEALNQMALTRVMTERELSFLMNNQLETFTQKINKMEQIQRSQSGHFKRIDLQILDLRGSVSADKKRITEQLHQIEGKSNELAREVQIFKINAEESLKTISDGLDNMKSELTSLTDTMGQLADCVGMDNPFPNIIQMFAALSKEVENLAEETEMIKEKNQGVYEFFDCLRSA